MTAAANHGLSWSIKRSFARYVAGLVDGRIRVSDDVLPTEDDRLFFPALAMPDNGPRTLNFGGMAEFSGHFGMLRVLIAQPLLVLDEDGLSGTILIGEPTARRPLVRCKCTHEKQAGTHAIHGGNVTLCDESTPLFGGSYVVGEPFDDFTILIDGDRP